MTAALSTEPVGSAPGDGADRLVLAPFRGVRFDPGRVPDLAAVTTPPYDVVDDDWAQRLRARDAHNLARLILPSGGPGDRSRYRRVAEELRRWRADGVLRQDPEPALYLYEQRAAATGGSATSDGMTHAAGPHDGTTHAAGPQDGTTHGPASHSPATHGLGAAVADPGAGAVVRGLIGALGLRDPRSGIVLPHEDVMPGPVADRLALLRETQANLEPILLTYDGGGAASEVVAAVAGATPLLEFTADDGTRHRMWAVTDPAHLDAVATDLAARRALIADGHHRYATYRLWQDEQRRRQPDAPAGRLAADYGLAMLVDAAVTPLTLGPIARVVQGLDLATALGRLEERGGWRVDRRPSGLGTLVLAGGEARASISPQDRSALAASLDPARPRLWRQLDATLLHEVLLPLWEVREESRVSYHHDAAEAVASAARGGGLAVLLPPPALPDVLALAGMGERMPRKSTSFGPKPRTGLVMRMLDRADGP